CDVFLFVLQEEDGIRGRNVTGVQTCALPIFSGYFLMTFPTEEANLSWRNSTMTVGLMYLTFSPVSTICFTFRTTAKSSSGSAIVMAGVIFTVMTTRETSKIRLPAATGKFPK